MGNSHSAAAHSSAGGESPDVPPMALSHSNSLTETTVHEFFTLALPDTPPPRDKDYDLKKTRMDKVVEEFSIAIPLGCYGWDEYSRVEQAKITFLLVKQQHRFLLSTLQKLYPTADMQQLLDVMGRIIHASVRDVNSPYFQQLVYFVRGDEQSVTLGDAEDYYNSFLAKYPNFGDFENAPSIFNGTAGRHVDPLHRFQHDLSNVCYFVAAANSIYYSQVRNSGTARGEAVAAYAVNVGRHKRSCFEKEDIFRAIFLLEGGFSQKALESLLRPNNPGIKDLVHRMFICSRLDDADRRYAMANAHIQMYGALIISIELFQEYIADDDIVVYEGDWSTKQKLEINSPTFGGFQLLPPNTPQLHSVLVVGVERTEDTVSGGMRFLVQDTACNKPFKVIGYDLLVSMGSYPGERLTFDAPIPGLVFDSGSDNVDGDSNVLHSGASSPLNFHEGTNLLGDFSSALGLTPVSRRLPFGDNGPGLEGFARAAINNNDPPEWNEDMYIRIDPKKPRVIISGGPL